MKKKHIVLATLTLVTLSVLGSYQSDWLAGNLRNRHQENRDVNSSAAKQDDFDVIPVGETTDGPVVVIERDGDTVKATKYESLEAYKAGDDPVEQKNCYNMTNEGCADSFEADNNN